MTRGSARVDRAARGQDGLLDDDRWGLLSPRLQERRAAVRELLRRPLASRRSLTALRDRLLNDPDPQIRLDALEALSRHRGAVKARSLRPALSDPLEEVRERVSAMLAEVGELTADDIVPTREDHPRTEPRTVLHALARAAEREALDDGGLRLALVAVAALPSTARLRTPALVGLARAIGPERLRTALGGDPDSRLGAARLLMADERPWALATVAERRNDELEEIRVAATLARSLLDGVPPSSEGRPPVAPPPEAAGKSPRTHDDGLASRELLALLDEPTPSVRRAAAIDLLRAGGEAIASRVVRSLPADELDPVLRGLSRIDGEERSRRILDLATKGPRAGEAPAADDLRPGESPPRRRPGGRRTGR